MPHLGGLPHPLARPEDAPSGRVAIDNLGNIFDFEEMRAYANALLVAAGLPPSAGAGADLTLEQAFALQGRAPDGSPLAADGPFVGELTVSGSTNVLPIVLLAAGAGVAVWLLSRS